MVKGTSLTKVFYRQNLQDNMDFMLVWFSMHRAAYDQRRGVNQQYDEVTADSNHRTDSRVSQPTKTQSELPREFSFQSLDGRDV